MQLQKHKTTHPAGGEDGAENNTWPPQRRPPISTPPPSPRVGRSQMLTPDPACADRLAMTSRCSGQPWAGPPTMPHPCTSPCYRARCPYSPSESGSEARFPSRGVRCGAVVRDARIRGAGSALPITSRRVSASCRGGRHCTSVAQHRGDGTEALSCQNSFGSVRRLAWIQECMWRSWRSTSGQIGRNSALEDNDCRGPRLECIVAIRSGPASGPDGWNYVGIAQIG
jgi:hypothetical protein